MSDVDLALDQADVEALARYRMGAAPADVDQTILSDAGRRMFEHLTTCTTDNREAAVSGAAMSAGLPWIEVEDAVAAAIARHKSPLPDDPATRDRVGGNVVSSVSSVVQWSEPDRIFGPIAAPKLPMGLLPVEIANVAQDVAERQQSPVDYTAWALIVAAAGIIGREPGIRPRERDDWTERLALWVNLIGKPSTMKSPALDDGTRPLRVQAAHFADQHAAAMEKWREECAAAKELDPKHPDLPPQPLMRRCWTADGSVEKLAMLLVPEVSRGLSIVRDELSGLIRDLDRYHPKGGDRQFYITAYTGGQYVVDRVSRETLVVPDLLFNIVGGIQPEVARSVFNDGPRDGFAARFITIWPEVLPNYTLTDRWPDQEARTALDAVLERLSVARWRAELANDDFKPTPFCRLDADGQQPFSDWHEKLMRTWRSGTYQGQFEDRVGKYPGLASRLMLVWHLIDWGANRTNFATKVEGGVVQRVLRLMDEYVMPMEKRVYAAYDVTPDDEGGQRIAQWLLDQPPDKRPAEITGHEIRRREWSGLKEQATIHAALQWLVAHQWLAEVERPTRPGRPSDKYLVNPRIAEIEDRHVA